MIIRAKLLKYRSRGTTKEIGILFSQFKFNLKERMGFPLSINLKIKLLKRQRNRRNREKK